MKIREFLAILFVSLLVYACAQRGRPDGGPIDEDPPKIVTERPANFSNFFDKEELEITFNEFIKLDDPRNQIIFSPPIEPRPQILPMGLASKTLSIKFDLDSLQKETTYTINFGKSIEDNNEGNTFPFYKYVFSTGSYLDSLAIQGKVYQPSKRVADEFISILLYQIDSVYSDSVVYQKMPTYISYTQDSTNTFQLENMKAGKYKLVAISDKNNNYKFEAAQDEIGFLQDTIVLPRDHEESFSLSLFKEAVDFKAERPEQDNLNKIIFGYRGEITKENHSIELLGEKPDDFTYQIWKEKDADTLNYWFKPYLERDSLLFVFGNEKKFDTVYFYPKELEIPDSLKIAFEPKGNIYYDEPIKITANIPLVEFEKDSMLLMNTKDSVAVDFSLALDKYRNQLEVQFEKNEQKSYELQILPGGVTSFFDEVNDTLSLKVSTKKYSDYGNLVLTLQNIKSYPIIVQLITAEDEVKYEQFSENAQVFEFNYLEPAEYYIRVIYDENKNQKWDTGDYLEKIQPEAVDYYMEPIKIRANWDDSHVISLPD
ncbi:Ig-like domain-containing protein [Psychroflexus planctonicus]|uniref:SbsA Ig-like domain-containing protein n=1 Tax=Psychroflexus planctonicus TaxID=1526575 RepID=A0ABQ1SDZ1_9FLAO|nr:Ig-like domain-containing protein [Psychroflexus planctonicus]GGE25831.1 hypothetical protein GCM10010832_03220 [Psychroflexus planctonicus]